MHRPNAGVVVALVGLGAIAAILMSGTSTPPATAQVGLFGDVPPFRQPSAPSGTDGPAVRTRPVQVNLGLIDGAPRATGVRGGAGDTLELNLFPAESPQLPAVTLTAIRDAVRPTHTGRGYIWTGHVQGAPQGLDHVTIVVENGVMVANVRAGPAAYQVRYVGDGVYVVQQVDTQLPIRDEHLLPAGRVTGRAALLARAAPRSLGLARPVEQAAAPLRVDLLVAYTTNAMNEAGGTSAMLAKINLAVTEANRVYTNTGINQVLNLHGTIEVGYAAQYPQQNGSFQADLRCVTGTYYNGTGDVFDPSATCLRNVRDLRDQLGADVVSFWLEGALTQGQQVCGIAYVWPSGFTGANMAIYAHSVVKASCANDPYYAFVHELGHIMAANHDRTTDANVSNPLFPYAFDYIVGSSSAGPFRTVMAYPGPCSNCPIVPYFSNPDIILNGQPIGNATTADNRRTLNQTNVQVAAFRTCLLNCEGTAPTLTLTPTQTLTPTRTLTATRTPTPTPTPNCANRPPITTRTAATGTSLQVTILTGRSDIRLREIWFRDMTNARVTTPDNQQITGPWTTDMDALGSPTTTTFTVARQNPGVSTLVNMTIRDDCGAWPTFVGGGTSAPF